MNIQFTEEAWKDFEWFLDNDKQLLKRIRTLLKDMLRNPTEGIGKPEKLRFDLTGCWSCRLRAQLQPDDYAESSILL